MSDSNIRSQLRTLLANLGYHEADSLFSFGNVPQGIADKAFIIDRNSQQSDAAVTTGASNNIYFNVNLVVRILFQPGPSTFNQSMDAIHDALETIITTFLPQSNYPSGVRLVTFLSKTVKPEPTNLTYAIGELNFNFLDKYNFTS